MTESEAKVNAAQILTNLRRDFPGTLDGILEDIDMSDEVFDETLQTLDSSLRPKKNRKGKSPARVLSRSSRQELPYDGSHAPDCPYRCGGECLCWRSDPDQNPELSEE